MRSISLQHLGELLGGDVVGDGSIEIRGVAGIGEAGPGDISFVANPKYIHEIRDCRASALIVGRDLSTDFRPLLVTDDPYLAFTRALHILVGEQKTQQVGVHPKAIVASDAILEEAVSIMAHAVLDRGVHVGQRTVIYPGTFVGAQSRIGSDVTLYPNVTISPRTVIGNGVIIHGGTRLIDESGPEERGKGRILIEDDVELGANVTIAGGGSRDTLIGRGTKIDNLVGIRPGVQLGANCIVVAQVTIGENATLEERVTLAGQVVVCPGVRIGARAMVGAKSYVEQDLPGDQTYSGTPAQSHGMERRLHAYLRRVPDLRVRLDRLEQQVRCRKKDE